MISPNQGLTRQQVAARFPCVVGFIKALPLDLIPVVRFATATPFDLLMPDNTLNLPHWLAFKPINGWRCWAYPTTRHIRLDEGHMEHRMEVTPPIMQL
jgi:hypothetical protein